MPDLNRVYLMGNLTRDPELRYTPQGTAIASFGIGVNNRYKTANGELKEEANFFDITTFAGQADVCAKFLHKGSTVLIEGRLKLDRWEDKTTGKPRTKVHVLANRVQFLSPKKNGDANAGAEPSEAPAAGSTAVAEAEPPLEDDVPF